MLLVEAEAADENKADDGARLDAVVLMPATSSCNDKAANRDNPASAFEGGAAIDVGGSELTGCSTD